MLSAREIVAGVGVAVSAGGLVNAVWGVTTGWQPWPIHRQLSSRARWEQLPSMVLFAGLLLQNLPWLLDIPGWPSLALSLVGLACVVGSFVVARLVARRGDSRARSGGK